MINTVSKINLSKIGWEGVYLIWIIFLNILGGGYLFVWGYCSHSSLSVCVAFIIFHLVMCAPPGP